MRRTILITGHKGLIGTHLKEHFFCVAGDDVIGIGRETWGRIKENKETFSTFLHKQKLFPMLLFIVQERYTMNQICSIPMWSLQNRFLIML